MNPAVKQLFADYLPVTDGDKGPFRRWQAQSRATAGDSDASRFDEQI
jgi:hypothetical protein